MPMEGFFEMTTPAHLLQKLERDYARLQQDDEDVDAAYNFFATAENMPEWIKGGGRKGQAFKHRIQQQHLILTLCNELATGAKHFTSAKKKPAIASAAREGWIEPGWVEPGWVAAPLIIHLSPEQALTRGQEAIDVLALAGEVLAFWQRHLQGSSTP